MLNVNVLFFSCQSKLSVMSLLIFVGLQHYVSSNADRKEMGKTKIDTHFLKLIV